MEVMDKEEFIGLITASVSHELQNVLAVINESSGLAEDIIVYKGDSGSEMLKPPVKQIRKTVEKGAGIIRALNQFAHSARSPRSPFDPRDAVGLIVTLSRRLFERQGLSLSIEKEDVSVHLNSHHLLFLMLVFTAIRSVAAEKEKSEVVVSVSGEKLVTIRIDRVDGHAVNVSEADEIKEMLRVLAGKTGAEPVFSDKTSMALNF